MFEGKVLKVEGKIPLEVPGGANVEAELSIGLDGKISLTFTAPTLAGTLTSEAVAGRLVAMGVHYVSAGPSGVHAGRSEGSSEASPGHTCWCHLNKKGSCDACWRLNCTWHKEWWVHSCGVRNFVTLPRTEAKCPVCGTLMSLWIQEHSQNAQDDVNHQRILAAKDALVATEYFKPEELSDDIAPRITELWANRQDAPDEKED